MSTNDTFCRVCLEKARKLYPLQGPIANCDVNVKDMINYCTSIEIDLTDDLPSGVCVPCFRTVRIAYNFILQFRENNHKLITEKLDLEQFNKQTYIAIESNDSESQETPDNALIETETEQINEYESDEVVDIITNNYLKNDVVYKSEEIIEFEENDIQDQPDFEEYDQQDTEMENMNFLVDNVDSNADLSTDVRHISVKMIRKSPIPEVQQPQTVLRRKIKIRFACPVCPNLYFANFEGGLVPHMSLHSEEHFPCNICSENNVMFDSAAFLNHFMQYHRYQCPYCGRSFNKTGTLTAHIKTHYKFRYHCSNETCTKSFPTQWSLKKHEAVHSNSCLYSCTDCNMQFKTYDTYMYHLKKHGGKKFLCMACGRTFMQSVHLKYHMQQHTGVKYFKCNYCVKSYTSSSQLKKHKRRHHPEEVENTERPFVVDISSI